MSRSFLIRKLLSPAVSVNAYNRATNLDDLYFSLFKPATGAHWDGNLKKYKLATVTDVNGDPVPEVQDSLGNPAVDPNTGTAVWTNSGDGAKYTVHPHGGYSLLPGGKGETREGGIHVPSIAWWPGTIAPDQERNRRSMVKSKLI